MSTLIEAPAAKRQAHPKKEAGCGCGCGAESEPGCCELECQVRPNFFCGQLLNDTDLTRLITWVRSRLGLQRYRDGWGVVCGLDVECVSYDPCNKTRGPSVTVSPGYAIDCCGRDLVLCKASEIDLSRFCAPLDDPCADPASAPTQVQAWRLAAGIRELPSERDSDCEEILRASRENAVRVNLFLQYDETLAGGTRTVLGSKCGDSSGCRYTRIEETPRIVPVLAAEGDATPSALTQLQEELHDLSQGVLKVSDPNALLRMLEEEKYRPTTFCFLAEYLRCALRPREKRSDLWYVRAVGWILQDWILRQLRCRCAPCRTDEGVLLAQVWLVPAESRVGRTCRVFYVNSLPPYRRLLQRECPTYLGDLSPYIWREWNLRIQAELSRSKAVESSAIELDELSRDQLRQFYSSYRLTPSLDAKTVCYTLKDPTDVRRIAGFADPMAHKGGPKTGAKE